MKKFTIVSVLVIISLLVLAFVVKEKEPELNLFTTYTCPTGGVTVTKHAQHCSFATDSANVVQQLWLTGTRMYHPVINPGTNILVTGSEATGWTIANGVTNNNQLTNGSAYITGINSGNVTTALGFNPVTDARTLTINGVTYDLSANRSWSISIEPIGSVKMYAGSSAPSDYLFCDGSAVSRTTYSGLFAIIGTNYGSGNGSTTFNLPDTRQRFPLGLASSGTGSTLGGTGGNIDHVHSVDPPNTTTTSPSATIAATNLLTTAASPTHTHDVNISAFNSASANPPFLTFNYIIKF